MRERFLAKVSICTILLVVFGASVVPALSDSARESDKEPVVLLDDGLVGYWSFNDQANPGHDDSGNNHQGTVSGATWIPNGIKKGAMSFDGSDYISLPDFTSSDSQGTVVAWAKQSLAAGVAGHIYAEGCIDHDKPYIACGFKGGQLFFCRDVYGMDSNYQGVKEVGANDGQWHCVAYVVEGPTNRFYFDGEQVYLTWQDGNAPDGIWFDDQNTDTNSIGVVNRPDIWAFFNGVIDDVRIYNRPLSEEEILTLSTVLDITVKGGLGANLDIKNNGTVTAHDFDWQISVEGGILGRIDFTEIGTIDAIAPGESVRVGTRMIFGLGSIKITAKVNEEPITADGTQLFIFTMIKT